jgi:hypothetical protein
MNKRKPRHERGPRNQGGRATQKAPPCRQVYPPPDEIDHRTPAGEFRAVSMPDESGTYRVERFLKDDMSNVEYFRFLHIMGYLRRDPRYSNRERFKKVENTKLYEYKDFQIRILCFWQPSYLLVMAHALRKKKDGLSQPDVDAALRLKQLYQERGY